MAEFALIDRIREIAEAAGPHAGVVVGIGDDAAVLEIPGGYRLVATTDTLNEGVHFPRGIPAALLGHKALAVNLSDLAAMGAEPEWALLSLSLVQSDEAWLDEFMDGFSALAGEFAVSLVGGDLCSGPLSVTVTALGLVRGEGFLKRSGASPGDRVVVSGCLGDAAHALRELQAGGAGDTGKHKALHRPSPRVRLGLSLVGTASACIDVSDGLLADLGHIARASGIGASIDLGTLPASTALGRLDAEERWRLQLAGGDDYELCFTLPPERETALPDLARQAGVRLSVIGTMGGEPGIRCRTPEGRLFDPGGTGFEHFTGPEYHNGKRAADPD